MPAHSIGHVGAGFPLRNHRGDELRRVLQVGVDHDNNIPDGALQTGGGSGLLAEVARQVHHAHAAILGGQPVERLRGAIGAAVVDEDQLEGVVRQRGAGALDEGLDQRHLVVDRRDHAEQCGCAVALSGHEPQTVRPSVAP